MKKSIVSLVAVPFALIAACTAQPSSLDDDGAGASGAGSNNGGAGTTTTDAAVTVGVGSGGGSTGSGAPCNSGDDEDADADGWSKAEGDCNDCDANVNPDAVEVIGDTSDPEYDAADENCNNEVDEPPPVCDQSLGFNDTNALSGAKAIDLCQEAGVNGTWGVVTASYVRANGTALANPGLTVGLAPVFGANIHPQHGSAMLVMSSGYARPAGHPEACPFNGISCTNQGPGTAPPNFPQDVPSCPGQQNINDDVALELQVKAPSNATGYSFDFAFMSFEFPEWVCTSYNDQFIALVSPPPMGAINGNISFDANTNPVSVNIALFDHCDPSSISNYSGPNPPNPYCPAGPAFMNGTGYNQWNDAGATGWLVTTAPVDANETFTIRWAIWDTGDTAYDSTVVVDNFRWTAEPGTTVGTDPIPDPR